jgi:uncharacterized membrane protein YbjE (DUF340 family)
MLSNKDYANMTPETLVSEEKKMKSRKITVAFLIGFLVGIAIWGMTHNKGFFFTLILLYFPYRIGKQHSEDLKNIQAEISRRNAVG